ncbi:hypothetical protein CRP01_01130 [Flavilitoribacter nigricans DSM 23189 = NBRC 102662]|uniref:Uncharacterized protein n=1 Tax=Flavilitoribacter nigricans (strain ATCC 23147 / DSM 23189 / NBRC 102662 / NCIMB 1420 / SS-2) TaxID=1122177 RepID=A0A2D0NJK4_FLAN2|nr:hypothetical protein CRP01_01130 [Flavilitoribacter nigricans DSM 23189 = NBRC 102662]
MQALLPIGLSRGIREITRLGPGGELANGTRPAGYRPSSGVELLKYEMARRLFHPGHFARLEPKQEPAPAYYLKG